VAAVHKLIEELGTRGALQASESDADRKAVEAAIQYMSDEDVGIGFLYSGWCQAALPHKRLADDAVWKVQTERVTLMVEPGRRNLSGQDTEFCGVPYGSRARLDVAENPGGGTAVTITVPYITRAGSVPDASQPV